MDTITKVTFSDLLTPDRIFPRLRAENKREVMRVLAVHVSKTTGLEKQAITNALLYCADFPAFGPSTGVAVPHAILPGLKKPVAAYARLDPPLDFSASDGTLTDLVVLLLSPEEDLSAHLRALACIARRLRNHQVRDHLRVATCSDSIYAVLTDGA